MDLHPAPEVFWRTVVIRVRTESEFACAAAVSESFGNLHKLMPMSFSKTFVHLDMETAT